MPEDNGPRLQDPSAIFQQLTASKGISGGGGDDDKNHFENIADGLVSFVSRLLGKVGIKIRLRTLLSTGFLKQFTPAQAWSGKSINEGAPVMASRGGVLADVVIRKTDFKMDFSNIAKPAIEGLPVQAMSFASLGQLIPLDTGGSGRSSGGISV